MFRSLRSAGLLLSLCMQVQAGYSHHFRWLQPPDPMAMNRCIREMRRVIDARRSILAGIDGTGAPEIAEQNLVFNGMGDDGHEPFVFPGYVGQTERAPNVPSGYNFCKTAGKPYDQVVTACLLVARDHFPPAVLAIASDGSWTGGDWVRGANLYASVFGRPLKDPIAGAVVPGVPAHDAADDLAPIPTHTLVAVCLGVSVVAVMAKKLL